MSRNKRYALAFACFAILEWTAFIAMVVAGSWWGIFFALAGVMFTCFAVFSFKELKWWTGGKK